MDIEKVKLGQTVHCPEDRGGAPYKGVVTFVGTEVMQNDQGIDYIWVTVKDQWSDAHVWPSNRLS